MRIIVAGHIDIENSENRADIIDSAKPFVEAAWEEAGCIAYAWTPDPYKPHRIHVFEEWAGEKDLAAHLSGKPYLDMLGHLRAAGITNAVTQKYKIERFEPVYDDKGVPRADFFSE